MLYYTAHISCVCCMCMYFFCPILVSLWFPCDYTPFGRHYLKRYGYVKNQDLGDHIFQSILGVPKVDPTHLEDLQAQFLHAETTCQISTGTGSKWLFEILGRWKVSIFSPKPMGIPFEISDYCRVEDATSQATPMAFFPHSRRLCWLCRFCGAVQSS